MYDWPENVSGPATWSLRLLPQLRDLGIQLRCQVLCWEHSGPVVENLKKNEIPFRETVCAPFTEEKVRWVLSDLVESPPDIFVANNVTPCFFAARWARQCGISTVGVLHSDDVFYQGIQSEFVFGRAKDAVSCVVAVSCELQRQVLEREPTETQVHRIPYGVPVPDFTRVPRDGQLRLIYAGRLADEQKRISEVTRSLCRAAREIEGVSAVIYGDGPDKNRVEEILRTEGQGLPVTLGGRVSSDEIQSRMVESDALVLLSDYEGLPIAVMEAMSCGVVPVCLQMRSGIPELVDHGATGLIISDRGDDFIAAIRRLRNEPQLLERLSVAARQEILDNYSSEHNAQQWAELLWSLHDNSPGRRQIIIPRSFDLPTVHPALACEDLRRPVVSWADRTLGRFRKSFGRIRREWL